MSGTETSKLVPLSRAEAWESKTAWPLLVLALAFVALSTVVISDNGLSDNAQLLATVSLIALWVAFLCDFTIRLLLSQRRLRYLRTHLFEVITMVLPFLRAFLLVLYIWRIPSLRYTPSRQRLRFSLIATSLGLVFVYVFSTLVFLVEQGAPNATIVSFGDALWWAFSTIATVGYGDYTPVTVAGRFFAVLLMLGGLVIVGIVSATVISAITEQVTRGQARREAEAEAEANTDHKAAS